MFPYFLGCSMYYTLLFWKTRLHIWMIFDDNLIMINNVSIVVAKSIYMMWNECSAPRGQRFGVYITFYQILIHSFIHQICICERPEHIGPVGEFFPVVSGVHTAAPGRPDWWCLSVRVGRRDRRAAAVPSGARWLRAMHKIGKIGIYDGAAADEVLDPSAVQLCHVPLTEWLMPIHCRMAVAACTDLVQNEPTGELEWWVW